MGVAAPRWGASLVLGAELVLCCMGACTTVPVWCHLNWFTIFCSTIANTCLLNFRQVTYISSQQEIDLLIKCFLEKESASTLILNEWIFVQQLHKRGCFAAASLCLQIYLRTAGNSFQKFPDRKRAALQNFRTLANELIFVQPFAAFQWLFLETI